MTDERNRLFAQEQLGRPAPARLAAFSPSRTWAAFAYGQSNALPPWGYPTLSNIPYDGNLMFGGSLPPGNGTDVYDAWAASAPLKASSVPPSYVLGTDEKRAEEPVIAFCNYFKALSNERNGLEVDPSRTLVAANGAKAGAPLSYLIKNHTAGPGEYYGRFTNFVSRFDGDVLAIPFMQGEADYVGNTAHKTRALYKAGLAQLRSDMIADAGQSSDPLFLASIPGGVDTKDVDGLGARDLHISMAIQELAWESDLVCVGPYYALPKLASDPIHLVARGARDHGLKAAQAAARVILGGLSWEPCSPLQVETTGAETTVHLLVPSPPIQFAACAGTTLAAKGFYGIDASGPISVSSVAILDATRIKITWSRTPTGSPMLYYAGKAGYGADQNGIGNVCDSDPSQPDLSLWGSDLTPAEMRNWLTPFCVPMTWSRPGLF